jgi:transposase InsO family protein
VPVYDGFSKRLLCLAHRAQTTREKDDIELTTIIRDVFGKSRATYGTRRIQKLMVNRGRTVSRRRVGRLMREAELACKTKRKFKATTNSGHDLPIAPNQLDRKFNVHQPNQVYVGDITYSAPILRRYLSLILTKLEHVWNAFWPSEALMNRMPAFCYEKA